MVGFIDLLLSNPLLLFFAIAALLSFFQGGNKKGNHRGSSQPQRRQEMREVQENEETEFDWREIFRQENFPFGESSERETTSREIQPQPVQMGAPSSAVDTDEQLNQANLELQQKYERLKEKQKLAREKAELIENSPIFSGEITKSEPRKTELQFENISGDEVIKGLVWSEILNKPKSRK